MKYLWQTFPYYFVRYLLFIYLLLFYYFVFVLRYLLFIYLLLFYYFVFVLFCIILVEAISYIDPCKDIV